MMHSDEGARRNFMYTPKEHTGKPYTIRQLIERLEEIEADYSGDMQVRIISQPNHPFEYAVRGLAVSDDFGDEEDWEAPVAVYIVEGTQIGYGCRDAWDAAER